MGEVVSEVIIQAAATSFIHMQMLAMSQVLHSMRNTGSFRGSRAASFDGCGRAGGIGVSSGDMGGMWRYCGAPLSASAPLQPVQPRSLRARWISSRRSRMVSTSVMTQ
jgi:hypothetical protein